METETQSTGASNPTCCGKETDFIGVTESGSDKFHCRECYQITITNSARKKRGG